MEIKCAFSGLRSVKLLSFLVIRTVIFSCLMSEVWMHEINKVFNVPRTCVDVHIAHIYLNRY